LLHTFFRRLLGRTCCRCRYVEWMRTTGDGQVSRLVAVCRNPDSPHFDRPVPPERTCPYWEKGAKKPPPEVGDPTLTV